MLKRVIIGALVFVIALITWGCGQNASTKITDLEEVKTHGDYIVYNYANLKEAAQIIAKVEVVDDLAEDNSVILYDGEDENHLMSGYYALRNVKVLEIYKNVLNVADNSTLNVIEKAAITDTQYFHDEDYIPMEKGETYIVFLNNETASGELSIISCNNGIVNLQEPENSQYYNIAVKAIVEFDSDLSANEKKAILNSKHIKKPKKDSNSKVYVVPYGDEESQSLSCSI